MTVEDRLRATTEALYGTMREVRPLTLPQARPGRARPPREPRRWPGWAVPLTAAVAVIALAVTLAAVRDNRGASPAPPAPATHPAAAGIPRYYVQLGAYTPGSGQQRDAIVGDSHTGRVLATVEPPGDLTFEGVAGGATTDRLFVLDAVSAGEVALANHAGDDQHSWYQLRIAPGTAHPATLTKLAITGPNDSAQITGLALAPDGGTLAVYYQNDAATHSAGPFTLRIVSVLTGQVARTWTAPGKDLGYSSDPNLDNSSGLTWAVNGPTLAFRFPSGWPDYERTLNATGKGTSLVADSRSVFANPGNQNNCSSMLLSSDGRTLVCGTVGNALGGCRQQEPVFDLYSTATGRLDRVLYRYQGSCQGASAGLVWTGVGGSAIGVIQTQSSTGATHYTVGVVTPGKFTPLRVPIPVGYGSFTGELAF